MIGNDMAKRSGASRCVVLTGTVTDKLWLEALWSSHEKYCIERNGFGEAEK